jgi:outer membrane receptor protein involved in Fe transport
MKDLKRVNSAVILLAAFFLLMCYVASFAGTTGKIAGVVVDKATGEPLIGASIMIEGTKMGNMSMVDGSYFILNVPPGTYDITARLIGYQPVKVTGVLVKVDVTTEVNFDLAASAVEVEAITVIGERAVIQKDITANVRNIQTEQIEKMPVKQIEEILRTQVGFVTRNNEIHVRGGRAGEVLYIVDGVETRDPLGGLGLVKGGMNVTASNIEEIDILKGGFDAEYGNVQSAAVNIVTKEGSNKVTQGHIEFLTDDLGHPSLNKYSFNGDRLEFSLSGPEPLFTRYLLPALGIKFTGDKVSYFLNANAYKTDTHMDINEYATAKTAKRFKVDDILGFNIPERINNQYSLGLKLSYRASPDKKVVFSYKRNLDRYTLFFDPTSETRGDVSVWQYRYTPSTLPQFESKSNLMSLHFTHNVSKSSFYELTLSRYVAEFFMGPGNPKNPGSTVTPGDFLFYYEWEGYEDVNQNGVWDNAEEYLDVNANGIYDEGEPFIDTNKGKNGVYDPGEPFTDYYPYNGQYDLGERFVDLPGDGRWNNAEPFTDTDSNGVFDPDRQRMARGAAGIDQPEPYWDGDEVIGEPFIDVNKNGLFDGDTIDIFITAPGSPENHDLDFDGQYDGPNINWLLEGYRDLNKNGVYDPGEPHVPFIDYNKNGIYDPPNNMWDPGEPYTDLNGNGRYDGIDGFYDRGYERRCYYQNRKSTLWTMKFDYTNQFNKEHQLKTGLHLEYNHLYMADVRYPYYVYDGIPDGAPWPDHGIFRDFYDREPIRGAWYIQDKIEYGAMIAKLGFRWDFFIQDKGVTKIAPDSVENPLRSEVDEGKHKISPRLGVSYPITDKAKVYFNYGWFYQLPELRYMYARTTQGAAGLKLYGNYNLDYMKQVQYELGIQYAISESYKLDIAGFYKDYYDQLNTEEMREGPITWEYYRNMDYARARGMELQLDKRYGGYVSGYINYQYAFAYGKSSAEVSNYYDRFEEGKIPIQEFPLDWDVRHQLTFSLDLRIPPQEHPRLFGFKVPDSWGINVLWQYGSGFPFTPDPSYPGMHLRLKEQPLPNSERMPATSNVDLRFNKDFEMWKLNYSFVIWVSNVFDVRNIYQVYSTTGRPYTGQNKLSSELGGPIIFSGSEIQDNPLNYGPGRNIRLGISVNF